MKKAIAAALLLALMPSCGITPAETNPPTEQATVAATLPPETTVAVTFPPETTVPETTVSQITGWQEENGQRYYYDVFGEMITGWETIDGQIYLFGDDGAMVTGWYQQGEYSYYLQENGAAAVGPLEIEGKQYYFSPGGIQIVLVNPWNKVPGGYKSDPVQFEGGYYVGSACHDALQELFDACRAAGCSPVLISGHRSRSVQEQLFENKVKKLMDQGYSQSGAKKEAAKSVAVPGTSEHQLGLAVDIIDNGNWSLDETQAQTATQQWLMEHCWEYGFILRYPEGSTEITGIIYEPWHYRYVGVEVAMEIKSLGVTLEEYLDAVQQ